MERQASRVSSQYGIQGQSPKLQVRRSVFDNEVVVKEPGARRQPVVTFDGQSKRTRVRRWGAVFMYKGVH